MNSSSNRDAKRCWTLAFAAAIIPQVIGFSAANSQICSPNDGLAVEATRSELESLSMSLQQRLRVDGVSQITRDSISCEGREIAARLRDGDFLPGDRIVLRVIGETTLNDTLIVKNNRALPLPGLDDLPLDGILRSELRERMGAHLARFLRNPQFSVTSLIRLAVVGEVARPGFYSLPPDARIADAVMLAGGPTSNGDLGRLTVTRDGRSLFPEEQMRDIVARGVSLDGAGLVPGDAVAVGQRGRHDPQIYFQAGTVLLSALSTFLAWSTLSRRH